MKTVSKYENKFTLSCILRQQHLKQKLNTIRMHPVYILFSENDVACELRMRSCYFRFDRYFIILDVVWIRFVSSFYFGLLS